MQLRTHTPLRLRAIAALLITTLCTVANVLGQTFVTEWTASANGGVGPTGMALSTEGGTTFLYVSDHPRGRILKFNTATGAVVATLGSQGSGNGQFSQPYGIAIDKATGDLYVAERGNNRVQRITNTGTFVTAWGTAGTAQGQFNEPIGVALDSAGDVYVTEHTNHRVQKFHLAQSGGTWTATSTAMWGSLGTADGQFNTPYSVVVDSANTVWVADGRNARVQRFSNTGAFQSSIGGAGTAPGQFIVVTGVSIAPSGDFFVSSTNTDPTNASLADVNNQWISKFSSSGAFVSRFAGAYGSATGQFKLPFLAVVDANNRAYVSDYYNNRVQVFDLSATPPPSGGGTGGTGGATDTTAPTVASFTVASSTASSVTFQLTFDESVTGVDAADFTAATAGGATATIGAPSGSGAIYTIPVNFTGTGTIALQLKATGTGIADTSNNAFAAGATSATFTIGSTTPPPPSGGGTSPSSIVSATAPADGRYHKGDTLLFTLRFSTNVTVNASGAHAISTATDANAEKDGDKKSDDKGGKKDDDKKDDHGGSTSPGTGGTAPGNTVPHDDDDDDEDDAMPFFTWTAVDATAAKGTSGKVTYVSGSGTSTLQFRYKVKNGDVAPAGIQLGTTLQLPIGTTLRDAAGQSLPASALTIPWAKNPLPGVILDAAKENNGNGKGHDNRLVNLSSRLRVTGGDASRSVIAGFVVTGSAPKLILIRAIGPGLKSFGIRDALDAPRLELRDSTGKLLGGNDGWGNDVAIEAAAARVGAFKLLHGSHDSAILLALAPGAYTAQVSANGNGLALLEVYDASSGTELTSEQIVNISTRGFVDTGEGELVAGFVIAGSSPKKVLIRGVGPGLKAFGLTATLADPVLKLYASNNTAPVAQNDNWEAQSANAFAATPPTAAELAAATTAAGAFPLQAGSKDAALVLTLPPGNYSAVVSGANGGTGPGLVEVYEIPNP